MDQLFQNVNLLFATLSGIHVISGKFRAVEMGTEETIKHEKCIRARRSVLRLTFPDMISIGADQAGFRVGKPFEHREDTPLPCMLQHS
jgi:hypothetical protein